MMPDQKTCADLSFSHGKTKMVMENIVTLVSITFNEGKFFDIVFFECDHLNLNQPTLYQHFSKNTECDTSSREECDRLVDKFVEAITSFKIANDILQSRTHVDFTNN